MLWYHLIYILLFAEHRVTNHPLVYLMSPLPWLVSPLKFGAKGTGTRQSDTQHRHLGHAGRSTLLLHLTNLLR